VLIFDLSDAIAVFKNGCSIDENLYKLQFVNRPDKAIRILIKLFDSVARFYDICLPLSSEPQSFA
jgi:hypothetical protein